MAKRFPKNVSQATKRSGFTQPKTSKARHSHGKRTAAKQDNLRFARKGK